jgi:hypothetical protein
MTARCVAAAVLPAVRRAGARRRLRNVRPVTMPGQIAKEPRQALGRMSRPARSSVALLAIYRRRLSRA